MPQVTMPVIYSKEEVVTILGEHARKVAGEAVKGSGVTTTVTCKPAEVSGDKREEGTPEKPSIVPHDLESVTVLFTKPVKLS